MEKNVFSDEACAIIFMHYVIKKLNSKVTSEIARRYGSDADYAMFFRKIGYGFSVDETYRKNLEQAYNDSKALYRRLQPLALYEYSYYLSQLVYFLEQNPYETVEIGIITAAKKSGNLPPLRYYNKYAPVKNLSAEDAVRGLRYMKTLVSKTYGADPVEVGIPEASSVLYNIINKECKKDLAKQRANEFKLSKQAQEQASQSLGDGELISPFTLDNLACESELPPPPESELD